MEFREILERTIAAEGLSISVIAFIVWLAYWTGLALWHAARCGQTRRIALFHFVHTAELPELIYLVINATACAKHGGLKRTRI
jgi:hypothetical protein